MARGRGGAAPTRAVTSGEAPPSAFRFNDWNPNQMDAFMIRKAIESIQTFGFIDPVTVRRVDGELEVIDGEHRVRVALELGIPRIPYIEIDVTDAEARKLTIVLNELKGRYDARKMSDLLQEILDDTSMEDLAVALPFQEEALKSMIGIKDFDWGSLDPIAPTTPGPAPTNKGERWVEHNFRLPADADGIVRQALAKMKEMAPGIDDGKALELICAEFLASA